MVVFYLQSKGQDEEVNLGGPISQNDQKPPVLNQRENREFNEKNERMRDKK